MKVSQLSEASGISIATIKYYIREGLLHPGAGPNRSRYGDDHVERLALIRVLRDVADKPIASVRWIIEALDAGDDQRALGMALAEEEVTTTVAESSPAVGLVHSFASERGWRLGPDTPGLRKLVAAVTALEDYSPGMIDAGTLHRYAEVAEALAKHEIPAEWSPSSDREGSLVYAVVGTVLFEEVLVGLRRMALTDRNRRLVEGESADG